MGRVYLCLGQNAELPYYFEKAKVHIWNIEELCYFIRENAWIMEPELLTKELIPIRNDRQYPRLQTAHFRKPRYFIYRAA